MNNYVITKTHSTKKIYFSNTSSFWPNSRNKEDSNVAVVSWPEKVFNKFNVIFMYIL